MVYALGFQNSLRTWNLYPLTNVSLFPCTPHPGSGRIVSLTRSDTQGLNSVMYPHSASCWVHNPPESPSAPQQGALFLGPNAYVGILFFWKIHAQ